MINQFLNNLQDLILPLKRGEILQVGKNKRKTKKGGLIGR